MIDEVKQFIDKLTKLSQETGIGIGGCGCQGSPYLYKLPKNKPLAYAANKITLDPSPPDNSVLAENLEVTVK